MGNRAVIVFRQPSASTPAIYLHWNGGLASVLGFLAAARELDIHTLVDFEGLIKRWMSSVYLETYGKADTDNGDNGVYIINPASLTIAGRLFAPNEEEVNPEKTEEITKLVLAAHRRLTSAH